MHDVAILMFDGVEVLDFAAPFEVLSLAGTRIEPGAISVRTVSTSPQVMARNGLEVRPSVWETLPTAVDVLVLPGGPGVEPTIERDAAAMRWIAETVPRAKWVMSICSGAVFLAKLGLLKGRRATTHHSDFEVVRRLEPSVQIERNKRFVRDGKFVMSAGISAGLDSSLFLVSELLGQEVAVRTADWLEYLSDGWKSDQS